MFIEDKRIFYAKNSLKSSNINDSVRSPSSLLTSRHSTFEIRIIIQLIWKCYQKSVEILIKSGSFRNWIEIIRKTFSKEIIIDMYFWLIKQWNGLTTSSISRIKWNRDHILESIEFKQILLSFSSFFVSFYDILTINQMSFWLLLLFLL